MRLLPRLLPLRRLLLHLLFVPPPRISSPNSWRCSWRRRRLRHKQSLKNDHLRLDPRRPIQENLTWIAITFVSNVRIISKLQVLPGWIVPHSQPHSSVAPSASDGLSTSAATRAPLRSRGQSSKPSSERTLGILRFSSTTSGVSLERTPSTSWKRPETGHHTSSTSNPSWQSSTLSGPPTSQLWFATFGKASNLPSRSKWSSRTGHRLASRRWCREWSTQRPRQV